MAAIRLARRTKGADVKVTLVSPVDRFVERLRLHQIATGQRLREHRLSELLDGSGVKLVVGWAESIDRERHSVVVNGEPLRYDRLIVAIGSHADTSVVPGAAEHALPVDDYDSATSVAARLAGLPDGGHVTVVGGGLTAVETAAEIAESHPRLHVTLASAGAPASMMGPRARSHMSKAFRRLGVEVRSGVPVEKVLPDQVRLADGSNLPADLCVWAAGVTVPRLAAESGLACDGHGRVETDGQLRSVSNPEVYAIGDAAAIRQPYGVMHGTCQSGIPTAAFVADQVASDLAGRRHKPFRFGYFHQPVSLGRRDAVIQFVRADDTPRRGLLTGRAAVAYKQTVSSSPIPTYRMSRRFTVPTAMMWTRGGRRRHAAA
jgi:NADH dehydrogenase FAD-containing subunit